MAPFQALEQLVANDHRGATRNAHQVEPLTVKFEFNSIINHGAVEGSRS